MFRPSVNHIWQQPIHKHPPWHGPDISVGLCQATPHVWIKLWCARVLQSAGGSVQVKQLVKRPDHSPPSHFTKMSLLVSAVTQTPNECSPSSCLSYSAIVLNSLFFCCLLYFHSPPPPPPPHIVWHTQWMKTALDLFYSNPGPLSQGNQQAKMGSDLSY